MRFLLLFFILFFAVQPMGFTAPPPLRTSLLTCLSVLKESAFEGATGPERELAERFRRELASLYGLYPTNVLESSDLANVLKSLGQLKIKGAQLPVLIGDGFHILARIDALSKIL